MRIVIALLSLILATNSFAETALLHCYSGKYTIFKKTVNDFFLDDGLVAASDKRNTYYIVGDCVLTYQHPKARK